MQFCWMLWGKNGKLPFGYWNRNNFYICSVFDCIPCKQFNKPRSCNETSVWNFKRSSWLQVKVIISKTNNKKHFMIFWDFSVFVWLKSIAESTYLLENYFKEICRFSERPRISFLLFLVSLENLNTLRTDFLLK